MNTLRSQICVTRLSRPKLIPYFGLESKPVFCNENDILHGLARSYTLMRAGALLARAGVCRRAQASTLVQTIRVRMRARTHAQEYARSQRAHSGASCAVQLQGMMIRRDATRLDKGAFSAHTGATFLFNHQLRVSTGELCAHTGTS